MNFMTFNNYWFSIQGQIIAQGCYGEIGNEIEELRRTADVTTAENDSHPKQDNPQVDKAKEDENVENPNWVSTRCILYM